MAEVKPFSCICPVKGKAASIAALPYDVYNRKEAQEEVKKRKASFLRIDRAETNFDENTGIYEEKVYEKAKELLWDMVEKGDFIEEKEPYYYIYELTMNGRVQNGIVACVAVDDYQKGIIKKHENTRAEKEADRIRHVDVCEAQTGPVFLAYRTNDIIRELVKAEKEKEAFYDFTSEDGIRHRVFCIREKEKIEKIRREFDKMGEIYIADGHHRAAAAVKVALMRREKYPEYTGEEQFNFFLSVLFPDDELMIMSYNRLVKDLNGLTEKEFLEKVRELFLVEVLSEKRPPAKKGEIVMLLGEKWYLLKIKEADRKKDPVENLDVSLLQELLLDKVLGIHNPKTDERIDFAGGIRGLEELENRVQTDCAAAFAMYPTSIEELFKVADAGRLMPPKSTWFEPKLRSGLFIHGIKEMKEREEKEVESWEKK